MTNELLTDERLAELDAQLRRLRAGPVRMDPNDVPDLLRLIEEVQASRRQSPSAEWRGIETTTVPARMRMEGEAVKAITFMLGSADADDDTPLDAILWVGDLVGDDGQPVHGLHLANAEYPEEGSITLVEFRLPNPPNQESEHG